MGFLTFSINVTLDGCVDHQEGIADDETHEELADPAPMDEACPSIEGGVAAFIAKYLAAPDTILVLQGPPGTGKTRLVRAMLAAMSRRKRDSANVLYTAATLAELYRAINTYIQGTILTVP